MRTTIRPLLAALIAPLLFSGGAALAGDIYTWKDAQGGVHYSDVKPDNDKAKVLKGGAQRDLPEPAAAPTKKEEVSDPEAASRKRRTEAADAQAKSEKERQQTAALKENCDALRNQLTALKNGERMARYNASGEKEVLDDAAREAEAARVQRTLDSSCK